MNRFTYDITVGLFLFGMVFAMPLWAQHDADRSRTDGADLIPFSIYYPVNKYTLSFDYMGNRERLDSIQTFFRNTSGIRSVVIYSRASPEGPFRFNERLAQRRGETARDFLLSALSDEICFSDSLMRLCPEAENWAGLCVALEADSLCPAREDALRIVRAALAPDEKKRQLKRLKQGRTWQYVLHRLMPGLRNATWVVVRRPLRMPQPLCPVSLPSEGVQMRPAPVVPQVERPPVRYERVTVLAVRSNLLYDALTLTNFSIEAPLYKDRASLLYYHQFPWWRAGEGNNKYCVRFLGIGGEARWWFKPQPRVAEGKRVERDKFMGHFLGLYGQGGKWDFEWKRDLCRQGEFWSVGLTYGYAMPVGHRLNLEFSLSAGYASIPYRGYTPSDDYSILIRDRSKTGTWHYFGPTQLAVSLVLPIRAKIPVKGGGR
ncbi:MAG: DUF3575 domain-containing protein [Bacteroidaceae bacterium]